LPLPRIPCPCDIMLPPHGEISPKPVIILLRMCRRVQVNEDEIFFVF
jgi:hypothetical protein